MSVTPMPLRSPPPDGRQPGGTRLSNLSERRRRAPSPAGIMRRRWLVNITKFVLPAAALMLLGSIVLWPEIQRVKDTSRVAFRRDAVESGQTQLTDAHYRGVNEKGEPYTVTAATGTQVTADRVNLTVPKADLLTQSGQWLMLQSEQGVFMQKANLLDLSGQVVLYRDDGTTLRTQSSTIDLTQGAAVGNVPVHAEGPFGTLDAQGYALTDKGNVVQFTGPAKLVLNGNDS